MLVRKKSFNWLIGLLCFVVVITMFATKTPANTARADNENTVKAAEIKAARTNNENAVRLPILMYHAVLKNVRGKYVVTPQTLENDFKFLIDNGYTSVHIADVVSYKENGTPLPQKPIMITFDDGNRSNYIHVFKLMKKYQIKCVFSVVGAYTDSNYDSGGNRILDNAAYLTYEHIDEMSKSGLAEFQNHSYSMHNLGKRRGMNKKKGESVEEYKTILAADLQKLNDCLKGKTQIECTAVAFPFGAYCSHTIDVAKSMGFKAALTCSEGVNILTRGSDLFALKRFNRPDSISTAAFFAKIEKSGK